MGNKFYKSAIKTWVESDVKKKNTAKQNNLNYIVFWKLSDFDIWKSLNYPNGKDYLEEYSWKKNLKERIL